MILEKIICHIHRHWLAVLLVVCGLRIGFLFANGLDLIGDESYYWDWSRRPDWCYYSKPPMVAWLIGIFTGIGGSTTEVVRLPAVLLSTVFLGYFYATARAFYGDRAAAVGLLLMLVMPFNVLANLLMTIDPPLYAFWMMALYYLRQALFDGKQQAWLWAGLATGAALLSKQVALCLPLLLLVFLVQDPLRRRFLAREFWLYLLPVVLCLIPLWLWNQQHDWVMLGHSKGHFGVKESITLIQRIKQAFEFLLYQCLLATPVIFVLAGIVSVKKVLGFSRQSAETRFLLLMGPVLLLAVLLLNGLQKVQGNWPIPFYFSTLLLLCGQWQAGRWRKTLDAGLLVGGVMVVLMYLMPVLMPKLVPALGWQNTQLDPTARMRNWRELATRVEAIRQRPDLGKSFLLVDAHRYLASELAFYLPDQPRVYRFEGSGQVVSQYEVWPGPIAELSKNALIVSEQNTRQLSPVLMSAFAKVKLVGEVALPDNSKHYYLYWGENLLAWSVTPIP
ncbi:hypothetical protein JCM14076_20650 [Methylosoma difficile]